MKNSDSSIGPRAAALQKTAKNESRVIRVGEFGVLRSSGIRRLAGFGSCVTRVGEFRGLRSSSGFRISTSGSCVIRVGDFKPQRDFRNSRLPTGVSSGIQEQIIQVRSRVPEQDWLTSRDTATPTSRPVVNVTRNMNLYSRLNARPR